MANYRVGDYIRLMRNAYDMSQEELAFHAGVATETISRIENGKHKITENVYRKIMSVFDYFPQQFYGICTDNDIEIIDIKQKVDDTEARWEYEKTKEYLEILKEKVEDTVVNQQYILRTEAIVDYYTGNIDECEMLEKLKKALSLTVADYEKYLLCEEMEAKAYPFLKQEALIVLNIADAYGKLKEYEQDERIKCMLLKCIEGEFVDESCISNLVLIIKRNLGHTMLLQKRYKEALDYLSQLLLEAKKIKNGVVISVLLSDIAWAMKKINQRSENKVFEEEKMKKILRQAYYVATARNDVRISEIIKNALSKDYDEVNLL